MQADIRFPIGLLFSIIGVILAVYGFMTSGAEMYRMHAVWRCPGCGFKTDCGGW
jgi:hypothetical protein